MSRTSKDESADLALLARTLEGHGGDRDRWPAGVRLRLARLLAESGEAQRMQQEAAALDRLLDLAPSVPPEREAALAERIVARAGRLPQVAATGCGTRTSPGIGRLPSVMPAGLLPRISRIAPAASLLAAALVLGIFTGWQSELLAPSGATSRTATEIADASDTVDLSDVVFGEVTVDPIEEELL